MALNKMKIGDVIKLIDERNSKNKNFDFYGININKEFMPTVANTDEIDAKKYKVVTSHRFVFSGMQTGRDQCIRIGLYKENDPVIVSPAYLTFEIERKDIVLEEYFFMLFLSKEMDRYGWFISDSSVRSNLDWERFCDIEIDLPDIKVQQKYVDIYNAMVQNQKVYEQSLDDLKLTCDAYIEKLRHELPNIAIGEYIEESDVRNSAHNAMVESVKGITTARQFIETKADMDGVGLDRYKVVYPDYFAYIPDTSRRGDKISLALNSSKDVYLVSSISSVFKVKQIIPQYLFLFFCRDEFNRYTRFHSWGSAREVFSFEDMCEVEIPIPDIEVQHDIANIFNAYSNRKNINEKLKAQIRGICPILIKGALEEGAEG
jgi:type I restriction enzyme S subunit